MSRGGRKSLRLVHAKTLRQNHHGRKADALHITALVDPHESGPSLDDLKKYADAGASRVVLFSQRMAIAIADGAALEFIKRFEPVVERAQKVAVA
jgi:hypothetical protein